MEAGGPLICVKRAWDRCEVRRGSSVGQMLSGITAPPTHLAAAAQVGEPRWNRCLPRLWGSCKERVACQPEGRGGGTICPGAPPLPPPCSHTCNTCSGSHSAASPVGFLGRRREPSRARKPLSKRSSSSLGRTWGLKGPDPLPVLGEAHLGPPPGDHPSPTPVWGGKTPPPFPGALPGAPPPTSAQPISRVGGGKRLR